MVTFWSLLDTTSFFILLVLNVSTFMEIVNVIEFKLVKFLTNSKALNVILLSFKNSVFSELTEFKKNKCVCHIIMSCDISSFFDWRLLSVHMKLI